MKRDSALIGILAASALVLALLVALLPPATRVAKGDMLTETHRYIMMTSGTGNDIPNLLDIIDRRDGILLQYTIRARQLVLIQAYDLNRQFRAPRIGGRRRRR